MPVTLTQPETLDDPQIRLNEDDLVSSICKESFFEFVKEFWDVVIPETYIDNWHIEYLCNELQVDCERLFLSQPRLHDIVINISPGSTKSTIVSVLLPAWAWIRFPTCRSICGSHGASLALDLSRKSRMVVKSEKYQRIFSNIRLNRDQDSKSYFVNSKGGFRFCVGTGGSVVGMHAHLLIVDDPIDPQGAISEAELLSANKWMDETLATRKVDKEISLTILIMQRLHQNDCTANMLKKTDKIKHICLPAEDSEHVKPEALKAFYNDDGDGNRLMDTTRLTKKTLDECKKKLGQYGFAGQFGQYPVPPGGGMFKTDRITITEPPRLDQPNLWDQRFVRSWDKASTQDGGCYTAGVKMGLDSKKRLWVLNVKHGQWGTDIREAVTKQTARMDGYDTDIMLEQEPGSGGKDSALATARNLMGYRVIIERPTGNKIYRADPLSVQVNNGNVFMAPGEWNQDFLDEMRFFPLSTYKDQIDAASAAANRLMEGKQHAGQAN